MKHAASRRFVLAVAVCLCSGSLARADYIAQFNFTPDKTELLASNDPTLGKITLSNESPSKAWGDTRLIAANIATESTANPANPAVFKDAVYHLTLFLTDTSTGKSDQMFFSGKFSGKLTAGTSQLTHEFLAPEEVTKQIGNRIYTVKVGPVVMPGNPTSGKVGSIGALATITVAAPEPGTFALAAVGLAVVGGGWWSRRAVKRPG